MAKARKTVKKSAAGEALGTPAFSSKTVLFPDAVASKKPVKRSAAKLSKVRQARQALVLSSVPAAVVVNEPEREIPAAPQEKPAVKGVDLVSERESRQVKARAPRKGILSAACFWAGSVLSDSNAFLRRKAN